MLEIMLAVIIFVLAICTGMFIGTKLWHLMEIRSLARFDIKYPTTCKDMFNTKSDADMRKTFAYRYLYRKYSISLAPSPQPDFPTL